MDPKLSALSASWRQRAADLRRFGAEVQALTCTELAAELEATAEAMGEAGDEALPLESAALESGYTVEHLRRLLGAGTIPNAGTSGRMRILRSHLPRKPGHGIVAPPKLRTVDSKSQVLRAALHGGR